VTKGEIAKALSPFCLIEFRHGLGRSHFYQPQEESHRESTCNPCSA
jgi:hypothetical protein